MRATLVDIPVRATDAGASREEDPRSVSTSSRFSDTALRLVILIALYAIPAIMVMKPVQDLDIWWHLRTGQWIVEHAMVPVTDPFSTLRPGQALGRL